MKHFMTPLESLGAIDAETSATLIAAAADIALIVDRAGVIRDIAFHSDDLFRELEGSPLWPGMQWSDTVTIESRPKVEALLSEKSDNSAPKWRHINQTSSRGPAVPVLYSAIRVGDEGRVVVFGRDLRAMSQLQQRLVDAQQSMERDYSRLRQLEMRYRLLFQMLSDPFFIVDADSHAIVEANPAAGRMLDKPASRTRDRSFFEVFDAVSVPSVEALLAVVKAAGRADDVRARLAHDKGEFLVSATLFRQETTPLFLVRLAPLEPGEADSAVPKLKLKLLKFVERAPDGFVITGPDGRILTANTAFLDIAQLATDPQAIGHNLERWLGRPGVDFHVLVSNLRQHGSVRLFATIVRGEYGATAEVEVSAVAVMNGEKECLGFTIRNVGLRLKSEPRPAHELPRSIEQLTELVGRVSLKDLVREATDVIERLSIEAALELTGDNRASAAEMLGLSRQSLYVKLRRYGLADAPEENNDH